MQLRGAVDVPLRPHGDVQLWPWGNRNEGPVKRTLGYNCVRTKVRRYRALRKVSSEIVNPAFTDEVGTLDWHT